MASHTDSNPTRSRETLWAILGSAVVAIILATVIAGNPFRALQLAYLDYSHTPAGGAPKGAPQPQPVATVPSQK